MRYFWVFLTVSQIFSCQHRGVPANATGETNFKGCYFLPLKKSDLGYTEVNPFVDNKKGLVLVGKKRSLKSSFYFAPLSEDKLELKSLKSLNWPDETVLFGAGTVRNRLVASLYTPEKSGRSKLELRDLSTNTVSALSQAERSIQKLGKAFFHSNQGFWLLEKTGVDDEGYAIQDKPAYISYVAIDNKGKLYKNSIKNLRFFGKVFVLPGKTANNAMVIWMEEKRGRNSSVFSFKYVEIYSNGRSSPVRTLAYQPKNEVESFDVVQTRDSIYLASVEGDSLLGTAQLQLSKILWNSSYLSVSWSNLMDLDGEHVSDPILVKRNNNVHLFLPKWMDSSVKISRFDVIGNKFKQIGVFGNFPEGTAVSSMYYNGLSKRFGLVLKVKREDFGLKHFLLCDVYP